MTEIGLLEWFEKVHRYWEKKWSLILTLIVIVATYFSLGKLVFEDDFNYKNKPVYITLIIILLSIIITWFLSTNRVFFKINKKDLTGILIMSEDDKEASFIKKIISNAIQEIESEDRFSQWQIIIFPINYCKNKKQIEKFVLNRQSQLDNLLVIKCESGKFESIDKISVKEIGFCFNSLVASSIQIYSEEIDLVQDLKLRGINKDWIAVEDNLGNDRKKILANIKDVLLFYFGIWKILNSDFNAALPALKSVYNHADTYLKETPNNNTISLTKSNIVAGRHRTILIELIIRISIELSNKNKYKEVFSFFEIGKPLIIKDQRGFVFYMNMARAAYECQRIEAAKYCTDMMNEINPGCVQVLLNRAFLNLIDGNPKLFLQLYERILISRKNYLDSPMNLLEFLNRQTKHHAAYKIYFDFAIGTINKLYADDELGQNMLEEVINCENDGMIYTDLIELAKKVFLFDPQKQPKPKYRKFKKKKKA